MGNPFFFKARVTRAHFGACFIIAFFFSPLFAHAAALSISGTTTNASGVAVAAGKAITLVIATSTASTHATTTDATGAFRFDIDANNSIGTGTPLTLYVDNDSTLRAVTVTKTASPTSITGLSLRQNRLTISHEATSGTSTTITDLAYDSDNDTDIPYTANSGTLLVAEDTELYINGGKTFAPGGTVYASSSVTVASGATFSAPSVMTINGTFSNNGTFTNNSGALTVDAVTSGVVAYLAGRDYSGSNNGTYGYGTKVFAVSGNYLYVGNLTYFAPTACSQTAGSAYPCELMVYDISSTTNPVYVAGRDLSGSTNGTAYGADIRSLAIVGSTLYVGNSGGSTACSQTVGSAQGCELQVYDISSSTNPVYVAGRDASGDSSGVGATSGYSFATVGSYLYVGTGGNAAACSQTAGSAIGCELQVYDISSTTNPIYVAGRDSAGDSVATGSISIYSLAVLNSTLYVAKNGNSTACSQTAGSAIGCELMVFDISSTTNPVYVAGRDTSGHSGGTGSLAINSLVIVGNALYGVKDGNANACSQTAGSAIGCELMVFDISSTTNPIYVAGRDSSGSSGGVASLNFNLLRFAGNYLYVGTGGNATACSQTAGSAIGCELQVYDISSTTNPIYVAGRDATGDSSGTGSTVAYALAPVGKYLYMGMGGDATACSQTAGSAIGCELMVFDAKSFPGYLLGSMTDTSALNNVVAKGVVILTAPASTTNFTISTGTTTVSNPLTVSGNYTNSGLFTTTAPTYFTGSSAQSLGGTMTGSSAFRDVTFLGNGTKTFSANASTSNFTIESTATVVAPTSLSVLGGLTNQGNLTSPTYLSVASYISDYLVGRDASGDSNGAVSVNINSLTAVGDYLFVGKAANSTACSQTAGSATGCELMVFDISSTTNPVYVAGRDAAGDSTATGSVAINALAVVGNYLYVGKAANATACSQTAGNAIGCELMVFDISSTTNPVYVAGRDAAGDSAATGSVAINSLSVLNSTLYVGKGGNATACSQTAGSAIGCELQVYDISSTTNPIYVAGRDAKGDSTGIGNAAHQFLTILGSTLYVGKGASATTCDGTTGNAIGCELMIYDISSTTNPVLVAGRDASGDSGGTGSANVSTLRVSGGYLYAGKSSSATPCSQTAGSAIGCELMVFDISSTTNPIYVAGRDVSGDTSGVESSNVNSLTAMGNYLYVGKGGNATACSQTAGSAIGCELQVYDISSTTNPIYVAGRDASGNLSGTGSANISPLAVVGNLMYVGKSGSTTACSQVAGSAMGCELSVFKLPATLSGTFTGTNALNYVSIAGVGAIFASNASTSDLTISSNATVAAPTVLTIAGNYANSGAFTHSNGTVYIASSTAAQSLSGTLTGTSALNNVSFLGASTKTFSNNASTTNLTVNTGATLVAPAALSIGGDFTQNGTFTANDGTVYIASTTAAQSLSGTLTGTSAFNTLRTLGATTTGTTTGLVGRWMFEEGSGTSVRDSSTYGNNGTITGSPSWPRGKFGGALDFYVSGLYASFGTNGQPTNTFTYGGWFKTSATHEIDTETNGGTDGLSGQKYAVTPSHGGSDAGAGLSVGTNGISVYEHGSSYIAPLSVYSGSIGSDWNHIVVVYNAKTPSIYLNGSLVHTGTTSVRPNVYAPNTVGDATTYGTFLGQIDDFRVYNRALTASEIQDLYLEKPKTFSANASTTNLTITSGVIDAPQQLSVAGNYANTGTFHANVGTTTLNGTTQQTISGAATGTSAFSNLILTNSTASTTFSTPLEVTNNFRALTPNTKIELLAGATSTLATTTITGTTGNEIKLRSTTPGTKAGLVVNGSYTVTYADIKDSSASSTSGSLNVSDGTSVNSGNNNGWTFVVTLNPLTMSGTLYSDEGVTQITGGKTIKIAIGTSTISIHSTTTNAGTGAWVVTVPDGQYVATSTPIVVFVDGDVTTRAARFTKASTTSPTTIPSLDLYQNRVIVSHEGTSGTSTTISDMSFYDVNSDSDIQYTATTSGSISLTVYKGNELHVAQNKTFAPGGTVTIRGNAGSGVDGSFHLPAGATFTEGGTTTIAGNFDASSTATFTHNGYTTMFNASTTDKTISVPGQNLGNVVFSYSGDPGTNVSFATTSTTTNLTITSGNVVAPATTLTVLGNYSNSGTFTANGGTVEFSSTTAPQSLSGTLTGTSAFNTLRTLGATTTGTTTGLVGRWMFEEGSGTTARDASGSGNTGTLTNGPTWTTGKAGGAVNFDGTDDHITMGAPSNLEFPGNYFTISAWIYPRSYGQNSKGRIVDKLSDVAHGYLFAMDNANTTNGISFMTDSTAAGTNSLQAPNSMTLNAWQHVVAVEWAGTGYIYVNGTQVATGAVWAPTAGTNNFVIGGRTTDNARNFDGYIDDVRVYNRALTASEIQDLYLEKPKTFSANASTTNLTITSGVIDAPQQLSVAGNYANTGTFHANVGTTTLNGTTQQTISGAATGTSAFHNLILTNSTASTTFSSPMTVTGNFRALTPNTKIELPAGATSTWSGSTIITGTSGSEVKLRSTTDGTKAGLIVNGSYTVTYADIKDSSASSTSGLLTATSSVDSGNNNGWTITVSGGSTITVSGVLYSDAGVTPFATPQALKLAVATATVSVYEGTTTVTTGAFSFSVLIGGVATATPVTIWTSGNSSLRAVTITKASSTQSISGVDLYKDRVIIKNENPSTATSTTVDDMAWYNGNNDSDIQFTTTATTSPTGTTTSLTVAGGQELYVFATSTFGIFGPTTVAGNFYVATSATVFASSTLTMGGNYTNAGTMLAATSTTWTPQTTAESNLWNAVAYGNDTFVAVSGDGTNRVMTSPDGVTWTPQTTPVSAWWSSIAYGNGKFVAVALFDDFSSPTTTLMTSPDGVTWTKQTAAEANQWASVTYGNGLFVAVSQDGINRVMTSPDGVTWTPQTAAEQNYWQSVTYGNGQFVAVAQAGTHRVMTSPDGVTWTPQTAAAQNYWYSVSYGNGQFIAVAASSSINSVMTSPDGVSWALQTAAEGNIWQSVTYGNGLFVAVAYNGIHQIMTSPDGVTWTPENSPESNGWLGVTYGNGMFVAVSQYGLHSVMTSPLSSTFMMSSSSAQTLSGNMTGTSVLPVLAFKGGGTKNFANVASSSAFTIASSSGVVSAPATLSVATNLTNGSSFTAPSSQLYLGGDYTNSGTFTHNSGTVTLTGSDQTATGTMIGSSAFNNLTIAGTGYKTFMTNASTTNLTINSATTFNAPPHMSISGNVTQNGTSTAVGGTWLRQHAAVNGSWTSVTYGNGLFVAVAEWGSGNGVMTSPDGITWTVRTPATDNRWKSVTYGNGLFVAVSEDGTGDRVMTSPDGVTWTSQASAGDHDWYSVTYGNGLFVAVACGVSGDSCNNSSGDRVMTSPDGVNWTSYPATADTYWYSVTYGNGLFVAVGISDIMTSPDGINWTSQTNPISNVSSVTYGNGLFVAVSYNGTDRVMTSPDGVTWTPRTAAEANSWESVTYGNGTFVAVSGDGTHRVMTSPDGVTWTPRTAAEANYWISVTYGNGLFVAVSDWGTYSVMTSVVSTTTLSGTSAQTVSGTLTGTSAFGNLEFTGAGSKAFSNNASSSNFVINSGSGAVTAPSLLSVSGNYNNAGTFTHNSGTVVFNGDGMQTLSGTMTGSSAFNTLVFNNTATRTIASNASTTNLTIGTNATVTALSSLTVTGNFTQNGAFVASIGTTTLSGTSQQTISGATTTFYNLAVLNSTASTTFNTPIAVTGTFAALTPSTTIEFAAGATSTLSGVTNIMGSTTGKVRLRSTTDGTKAGLSIATPYSITYADIKDSSATNTAGLVNVTDGTSADSGNNNGYDFTPPPASLSSEADQTFALGQAATAMSPITVTDGVTPTITSANDIRIIIASSTAHMAWDTTDTNATMSGTASNKVSGTVSYEGDSILVIDVTSDFAPSDTLTISDLAFTNFAAINSAASALGLRTAGAGTTTAASDDKTITITGSLTIAAHDQGQVADSFSFNQDTDVELMRYKLTPSGENMSALTTVFTLSGVHGVDTGDLTNLKLYRDTNADGVYDVTDVQIGGTGVVTINDQRGSITFSTQYSATSSQNYVLVGDYANVAPGDQMTVSLSTSGLTVVGSTTLGTVPVTGSVAAGRHMKGGQGYSGAPVGGDVPDGVDQGGGDETGGGEIDTNTGGTTLGNELGFRAPTANSGSWTNGGNGYDSDGTYATAGSAVTHTYSGLGFNVPGNNTITGIEVKLEASATSSAGTIQAELTWNDGSNYSSAKTTDTLTTTDAIYTLGSPSDTWGHSWTPSEALDGAFSVRVTAQPSSNLVKIDAIRVRIYYQATGGGQGGGGEVVRPFDRYFALVPGKGLVAGASTLTRIEDKYATMGALLNEIGTYLNRWYR